MPRAVQFHLSAEARSLFCIHYAPDPPTARGVLLYIHPFAEELNKSRRMAALQARAFAETGWHVLQLDLTGCGDSCGEFFDASWEVWLDDIFTARCWIRENIPGPVWLWGMRLGALLACASLERDPEPGAGLLFWQPVTSGSLHLQQFLRIKGAGELVGSKREGASTQALLEELRAGNSVEIAGYDLSPQLALPMADTSLNLPSAVSRVRWFEISPHADARLNPASLRIVDSWKDRVSIDTTVVQGPSFWQTQEIEEVPSLLKATTRAFSE